MSDIDHSRMIPLHIADQAVAACEKEIAALKAELTDCKATADRLKAEVERLTALVESNLNSSKVAMGNADAVLHERDSLKAAVERWKRNHAVVIEDRNTVLSSLVNVKAEVERLRAASFVTAVPVEQYERVIKAGDAMAVCITEFRCGKYGNAFDKVGGFYVWQDWLAAKEGKPSV